MRIDIHAINLELPAELKAYAEKRIWQAARRWPRRIAWSGMWLVRSEEGGDEAHLSCRLDAWVRGVGIVTVRHAGSEPYIAIDIAAARLEQSIAARMHTIGRETPAAERLEEQEAVVCG